MLKRILIMVFGIIIGVLMMKKSRTWKVMDFPSKMWGLMFIITGIGVGLGMNE